jgi:F420-dependent oxidoreductase-like protein
VIGINVSASNAQGFVATIREAEAAGVPAVWSTIGGAGGADLTVALGAAAAQTARVLMGTAIIPTWPRHPVVIAQQAQAIASIAPQRFRLGIGPSHQATMEQNFGVEWRTPITNLREHLVVISTLLHTGEVDFQGKHVKKAVARMSEPVDVPVMASALRKTSFRLCGELADGAISWVCPWDYLRNVALPAITEGSEAAGRTAPPLVAHVPICLTEEREQVRQAAGQQIGRYTRVPFYQAMFAEAGFEDLSGGVTDALIDALVVWGSPRKIQDRLGQILTEGAGEVIAHPLMFREDRAAEQQEAFLLVAAAN